MRGNNLFETNQKQWSNPIMEAQERILVMKQYQNFSAFTLPQPKFTDHFKSILNLQKIYRSISPFKEAQKTLINNKMLPKTLIFQQNLFNDMTNISGPVIRSLEYKKDLGGLSSLHFPELFAKESLKPVINFNDLLKNTSIFEPIKHKYPNVYEHLKLTNSFLSHPSDNQGEIFLSHTEQALFEQEVGNLNKDLTNSKGNMLDALNSFAIRIFNLKDTHPALCGVLLMLWGLYGGGIVQTINEQTIKTYHTLKIMVQGASKEEVKKLKDSATLSYPEAEIAIKNFRVVSRESKIYRSYKRKSGAIDTITNKRLVMILNKKKNWTYIMYTNESDEEVTGWIFTRNLKKY